MTGPKITEYRKVKVSPLTPLHIDVLNGAADGERCIDTAQRLGVSLQRVKNIRVAIISRMGADNIMQSVAFGFRRGILK